MSIFTKIATVFGFNRPEVEDIAPGVAVSVAAPGVITEELLERLTLGAFMASSQFAFKPVGGDPWVVVTQGSFWRPSAGEAHDGGGVVDLRSRHLTESERQTLVGALEAAGFGVYDLHHTAAPHLHCILSTSRVLNDTARTQLARLRRTNVAENHTK